MARQKSLNERRIYFDTQIYIYFFEHDTVHGNATEEIFIFALQNNFQIIASTLLITELLVQPLRTNSKKLVRLYSNLAFHISNLHYIDMNSDIAIEAAKLRSRHNISTPDSLHLATATKVGTDYFITNDLKLKQNSTVDIFTLEEFLIHMNH